MTGMLTVRERDELLIRIDERTECLPEMKKAVSHNTVWRQIIMGVLSMIAAAALGWLIRLESAVASLR